MRQRVNVVFSLDADGMAFLNGEPDFRCKDIEKALDLLAREIAGRCPKGWTWELKTRPQEVGGRSVQVFAAPPRGEEETTELYADEILSQAIEAVHGYEGLYVPRSP